MKKHIIYGLSLIFLAVGMNSCGKTTKRKITNDWKIVSIEEEQKATSVQADMENYWKTTMTESTVSNYSIYTIMGVDGPYTYTSESAGEVKENEFSIKNDGTWQWTQELYYDENSGMGYPFTTTTKRYLSGTWSFIGKTKGDDFKKNERVVFNILLNKKSTLEKNQTTVLTDYSEETTYLTGESTMTFTVKESKKKELQLEMESAFHYSFMGSINDNTQSKTLKMTLKEQ